jgi:hypothetical protein
MAHAADAEGGEGGTVGHDRSMLQAVRPVPC